MATIASHKSVEAPQQPKQPSRKSKRAWRKNVDISEIQAGLEEARAELSKGGILAEQPSSALFAVDTVGSADIQKSYTKTHKILTADQILAQRSPVSAVVNHKRPQGVTDGIIDKSGKRRKPNGVSRKEYERLREVAYGEKSVKDIIRTDDAPSCDLWAPQQQESIQDTRFSYLEEKRPPRAPLTIREPPISLVEGVAVVPSVAHPKGGTSYNPTFEDWDSLLRAEGAKEVAAEQRRREEAKKEEETLARIAAAEREGQGEEGAQTEDESAWEGFESEYEGVEWLANKRPERKTPQERRKAHRKKEREREEIAQKKMRDREKQQRRALELQTQLNKEQKKKALLPTPKSDTSTTTPLEVDDTVLRRRRLGKDFIPDRPLELVLPEELQDSLRLLKPEGNLLRDRFRNILASGKMETRRPIQQPKKKRRTLTEKWAYKDFQVGA